MAADAPLVQGARASAAIILIMWVTQVLVFHKEEFELPGPCITNVIATRRNNFSQWEHSFLWKLRCHWLKFLRRVAKTLVIQGPALSHCWEMIENAIYFLCFHMLFSITVKVSCVWLKWWPKACFNVRCTKSQNLNVSCLVISQLTLPNPLKPDVQSRMKM